MPQFDNLTKMCVIDIVILCTILSMIRYYKKKAFNTTAKEIYT